MISNTLYLEGPRLALLKQRSLIWEKNNFYRGDSELFPIFYAVNRLPDLATVWSCSGHKLERGRVYIMLSYTEKGLYQLLSLFAATQQQMVAASAKDAVVQPYDLNLRLSSALWPLDMDEGVYPIAVLEYNYRTWPERCKVLNILTKQFNELANISQVERVEAIPVTEDTRELVTDEAWLAEGKAVHTSCLEEYISRQGKSPIDMPEGLAESGLTLVIDYWRGRSVGAEVLRYTEATLKLAHGHSRHFRARNMKEAAERRRIFEAEVEKLRAEGTV